MSRVASSELRLVDSWGKAKLSQQPNQLEKLNILFKNDKSKKKASINVTNKE